MTAANVERLTVGLDTLVKLAMLMLVPLVAWALMSIISLKDNMALLRSDVRLVAAQVQTIERLDSRIADEASRTTTLGQRYNDLATRLAIIESKQGNPPR